MENYNLLIKWIIENGGSLDSTVYLDNSNPSNRTLCVNSDHEPGKILLAVPAKCSLKGENVFDTCLKLALEISKGASSFYYPYIQSLPTASDLIDIPIYEYFNKDLDELRKVCSPFVTLLELHYNNIKELHSNYLTINLDLPEKCKTIEFALYLITIYNTRVWENVGFIPLIDLCQHTNNIITNSSINVTPDFRNFVNRISLKKGDEITWCYNIKTNIVLYANYGIPQIIPQYINSSINYNFDLDTELVKFQKECLVANNLNVNNYMNILYSSNGFNSDLFNLGRILNMDDFDLKFIKFLNNNELKPVNFSNNNIISLRNELKTIKFFKQDLEQFKKIFTPQTEKVYPIITDMCNTNVAIINILLSQLQNYWLNYLNN